MSEEELAEQHGQMLLQQAANEKMAENLVWMYGALIFIALASLGVSIFAIYRVGSAQERTLSKVSKQVNQAREAWQKSGWTQKLVDSVGSHIINSMENHVVESPLRAEGKKKKRRGK